MSPDPYRYFRVEAREIVEQLGQGAIELERGASAAEVVPRMLRLAHTLKGAARVVKQPRIAEIAHALEDALALLPDAKGAPRGGLDALLSLVDAIGAQLVALAPPAPSLAPAAPRASSLPHEEVWEVGLADAAAVDALLYGLSEARVHVRSLGLVAERVERAARLADAIAEGRGDPGQARALAAQLRAEARQVGDHVATRAALLDRELDQVRVTAERLRLAPARSLLASLDRVARDAARSLGRAVELETAGGEIRVDARTLGGVRVALVQCIRNAVAHGIEAPDERARAGKSPLGRVRVSVERRGSRVAFVCHDDGRGVDLDAVRALAERRGLAGAAPGADALVEMLFQGGLSTSAAVSDVAGRGVGLSLVRTAIAKLRGEVALRTERGRFTAIEIVVPVAVVGLPTLLVEAGGVTAAIPLAAVRSAARVAAADVAAGAEGEVLAHDGEVLAYASLASMLGARRARGAEAHATVVIVGDGRSRVAVGVDRLRGIVDVAMRALPALAPPCALAAGAWLDADGAPRLVLDPEGLVAAARRARREAPVARAARAPVLVIDDSLTTRMLEQSILESAGYEVETAVSAEEGLERARLRGFALFLVDVEMPGMSGIEFVELTRRDPALRRVPAVLVTSLAAPADRRRGEAAGAAAYIVKGEFNQTDFLRTVRALIEG